MIVCFAHRDHDPDLLQSYIRKLREGRRKGANKKKKIVVCLIAESIPVIPVTLCDWSVLGGERHWKSSCTGTMIRIFPDFSVQVTASGVGGPGVGGGGGGSGGMGPQVGRIPGTSNGNPQNLQGINAYQQRYVCKKNDL